MGRKKKPEEDKKNKFALYIRDAVLEIAKKWYEQDNCNSISEFIEKAILFYGGFLASEQNDVFFPKVVISTLQGMLRDSENRLARILFKHAVAQSVTNNVLASLGDISKEDLEELRKNCVEEVRRTNGMIDLDEAVKWQNS